jgi:hypothetical protein
MGHHRVVIGEGFLDDLVTGSVYGGAVEEVIDAQGEPPTVISAGPATASAAVSILQL